ncbi:MAG: tRNA (adenosine(37)-N6)-dimethylallyltransferase MiaA [bacterium]
MYIIIAGPTCTGKSETAVRTAELVNGEVISADSMQVYRGMNIGTGKIQPGHMRGIPHHLIDILDVSEDFSAAKFRERCGALIKDILKRGKTPVVAGGTGLYIDVLISGIADIEEADKETKMKLRGLLDERGLDYIVGMLREKDPEEAGRVDVKNPRRVLRSLEIMEASGMRASEIKKKASENALKEKNKMFVLDMNREELYLRINRRVDEMIKKGLIKEVESLINSGAEPGMNSMQAIGYKEIAECIIAGRAPESAAEEIKKATRNYAKRQITWFKRYGNAGRIDTGAVSPEKAAEIIAGSCP